MKRDLIGQRYGRLVAIGEAEPAGKHRRILCRCDCGAERVVMYSNLANGDSRSCGCLKRERNGSRPGRIDLTGQRFGCWTVLREAAPSGSNRFWLCHCDCGTERPVDQGNLRSGLSVSCGCQGSRATIGARSIKHGQAIAGHNTREYETWCRMKDRCENPNTPQFSDYGGRGIKLCDRWQSFPAFFADMGPRPDGYSIERVDVDGHYEPSNCVWADRATQMNNTRRNRFVCHNGKTLTLAQWEREAGIPPGKLGQRLNRGWSMERALTEPYLPRCRKSIR